MLMKNLMLHLVNLPPFMYKAQEVEKFNILQKLIFVTKGKITSLSLTIQIKKCFVFMNLLFNKNGVIK